MSGYIFQTERSKKIVFYHISDDIIVKSPLAFVKNAAAGGRDKC